MRKIVITLLVLASAVSVTAQQPLTLGDAVRIALEKNPMRKAAIADVAIARSGVNSARSGLLPRIMFSEMATRGNDPVYVFGTRLRQQSFTAADFALNSLNTPTPIGNFTSKFSGQWRIFDSLRNYRGIERARKLDDASREQLKRTDQELIARVVQAYHGVLLARRHVAVAEDSLKTANSIADHSRNRVESGMAVDADLLSAQVLAASREQELISARNDLAFAGVQLALALGLQTNVNLVPSDLVTDKELPSPDISALEIDALNKRPDLARIRSEQGAQQRSVTMAKAAFGPRVDAFGSWQTDSHSLGWNGGNNWTAGLELQFDLFAGGAKMAELQREKAMADRIAALRSTFEDGVRLEVRRAYYDHDAARQQVAVAKTATQQATESLRILRNRYDAGLTTVTELLRAEEYAHRSQNDYWDAFYRARTSYANLELASGTLSPDSPVVTP